VGRKDIGNMQINQSANGQMDTFRLAAIYYWHLKSASKKWVQKNTLAFGSRLPK